MLEQEWNQVEQFTTLTNSTQVITDTDTVINNMQIIPPNKNASLHPIHFISQTKGVNITISDCSMEGLRLMLDNTNISLYIENSTFTAAGISIQSEDNTECLPVHIQSCHFSGHFPEDTLLFTNTDNVSIESCHFTDLQFSNDESSIIKGLNSSFHIDHSVFRNNTGSISVHGGSSQIINCSFTRSRSCLKGKETTVNISQSNFDGNRDGCFYGHNAVLHIVDSSLISNIAEQNGWAVNINSSQVTLDNCLLINNIARWYNHVYGQWRGDGGAVHAVNSQVTLGKCSLINNTASWGGAVYTMDNSHVTLGNCSLINNTASRAGGAVRAIFNSHVTLVNCSLINNIAWTVQNKDTYTVLYGTGGVVHAVNSHVTLHNCVLINNTAPWGGAVGTYDNSHVTLGSCSLINNTAGRNGGAVYADNSNVTLGKCSLINNTAQLGGAVGASYNSRVTLGNCSLINHTARGNGGAVRAISNSHVILVNCSLINNIAWTVQNKDTYTVLYGTGGVVHAVNSHVTLCNCALINNTARWGGAVGAYDNVI